VKLYKNFMEGNSVEAVNQLKAAGCAQGTTLWTSWCQTTLAPCRGN